MSVSDLVARFPRNGLHALASVGGMIIGLFLLIGASGHWSAVWPVMDGSAEALGADRFRLLLPGLVLAVPGLVNIALCRALWAGTTSALNLALGANLVAAAYLGYQLVQEVPDHPIGMFLAMVSSYVLVLTAIRMGLVWPAEKSEQAGLSGKSNAETK